MPPAPSQLDLIRNELAAKHGLYNNANRELTALNSAYSVAEAEFQRYEPNYTADKTARDDAQTNAADKKTQLLDVLNGLRAKILPDRLNTTDIVQTISRVTTTTSATDIQLMINDLPDTTTDAFLSEVKPFIDTALTSDDDIKTIGTTLRSSAEALKQALADKDHQENTFAPKERAHTDFENAKRDKAAKKIELDIFAKEIEKLKQQETIEVAIEKSQILNTGNAQYSPASARTMITAWHDTANATLKKPHVSSQITTTAFAYTRAAITIEVETGSAVPTIAAPGAPSDVLKTTIKVTNPYVKAKPSAYLSGDLTDDSIIMSFRSLSSQLNGQFVINTHGNHDDTLRMIAIADYLNTHADADMRTKARVKKAHGTHSMIFTRIWNKKELKRIGEELKAGRSTMKLPVAPAGPAPAPGAP